MLHILLSIILHEYFSSYKDRIFLLILGHSSFLELRFIIAFSKAFEGYKDYLNNYCKPVKILIEEALKEVDMSSVTDKLLEDIVNDVFPVCILFAM